MDPEWNYFASFLLEDVDGINLNIQVYDYDSGSFCAGVLRDKTMDDKLIYVPHDVT